MILNARAFRFSLRVIRGWLRSVTALRLRHRYRHRDLANTRTTHLSIFRLPRTPSTRCAFLKTGTYKGIEMLLNGPIWFPTFPFLFHPFLSKDHCALCPLGWTQVDIVALFTCKIKMDEGATVDNAKTVFFEFSIVKCGAVSLVNFKTIIRKFFG